ncbi:tail tape measure protein [Hoeflea sp. WL0058]|uniref:Tail tape measure protein n=1 Tax=Flavimaribacter sediminis TaxID=2865987 RepID=A0AAE2ZQF3_9HYPH|nr:tail tape measure protein [Flavimaribacter sediminis]MBW8639001.1 tail tape measure protein [Flavimaribacter sediminis]
MAERLGEALLELRTDDRGLNQGVDQAERKAKGLGATFDNVGGKALALGRSLALAGTVAAAGLAGIVSTVRDVARGIAETADQARIAGINVEAFQELKYVAEQSRIGVDALTDGIKELNLRADEFITTGTGSAAEAFQRLGYNAQTLREKLKDPSALFSEIIGKLGDLNKAAQIRVADEIFGGTGGERFVQLVEQGEQGIRDQIQAARDLGIVMDEDLVRKAEELDRQFNVVATTVGTALKRAIVEAASALGLFLDQFREFKNQSDVSLDERLAEIGMERLNLENQILELRERQANITGVLAQAEQRQLEGQIKQLEDRRAALGQDEESILAIIDSRNTPPPATSSPLPSEGFAVPTKSKSKNSGKTPQEEYDDLIATALIFIETQKIEQQALGMTEQAANALRYEQELLNEAKRADIELTPEQAQELAGLAQQMAAAEAATGALSDGIEFRSEVFRGFFSDLRSGLQEGKSFWESFRDAGLNALQKIADKIFDQMLDALDQLNGSLSSLGSGAGSGGGGLLGGIGSAIVGIFSGFFADGGLIPAGTFGIVGEKGPEPVIGTSRGAAVLPNSSLRSASAGRTEIVVGFDMDSFGNIVPAMQSISQEGIAGAAPAIMGGAVQQTNRNLSQMMAEKQRRQQ